MRKQRAFDASVVIPTFNRAGQLENLLRAFVEQSADSSCTFEILVCSDGSWDGTRELVSSFSRKHDIRFFDTENSQTNTVGLARNLGIAQAGSELLIFIDDDMMPCPNFVAEHVRSHRAADPKTIVYGPRYGSELDTVTEPPPDRAAVSHWRVINDLVQSGKEAPWEWAKFSNLSAWRAVFAQYGMFHTRFQGYGYEDTELLYRLKKSGCRFAFNIDAYTTHESNFDSVTVREKLHSLRTAAKLMKELHPDFTISRRDTDSIDWPEDILSLIRKL